MKMCKYVIMKLVRSCNSSFTLREASTATINIPCSTFLLPFFFFEAAESQWPTLLRRVQYVIVIRDLSS